MDTSGTNVTAPNYHGCTAPCMTRITFGNSAGDTRSSPFYDYNADALYVGDNAGVLHKFTGIFGSTTPAEASSPWPITVSSGATLSGPVYDSNAGTSTGSGNIYVGDSNGLLWYVRESGSTVGTCTASGSPPCLGQGSVNVGNSSLRPIVDAPIVDSSSEKVFAFIGCSGTSANCGHAENSVSVVQSPVDLGTGTVVTGAIGTSSRESNTFDGDFDNNYYSGNYANGHLYACGLLIGGAARTLYQLSFSAAGQLSTTVVTGPGLALDATSDCSSVTEIFNGTTDRIFMSVPNEGIPSGCTNSGCLMSFVVTAWEASTSYAAGQEILDSNGAIEDVTTGGTSGSTQPTWPGTGSNVTDGSVHWTNQGPFLGTTFPWQGGVTYGTGTVILDSNFNIEKVTAAGMSGLTQPTWPTTVGGIVVDKQVTWTNEGPGNANLAASGGASGIIMDNTVGTALSGASQVYFSPLLNGTCDAISSVGCAIQASQQGL
jgi:hypothetical protein